MIEEGSFYIPRFFFASSSSAGRKEEASVTDTSSFWQKRQKWQNRGCEASITEDDQEINFKIKHKGFEHNTVFAYSYPLR